MRTWLTARITTRALDWTFGSVKQPNILSWLHWPRTPASQAYVEHVFSVCGDLTTGKRNRLTNKLENRAFITINYKVQTLCLTYSVAYFTVYAKTQLQCSVQFFSKQRQNTSHSSAVSCIDLL